MTNFFQNAANFATKKIVDFVIYRFFFKKFKRKADVDLLKKAVKRKGRFCLLYI